MIHLNMPNKKELTIVIIWCIIIVFLSTIPYWFGSYYTPDGSTYMQFIGNNNDQSAYLAWIKQAEEGKILFEDKFTTESQQRVFLHPLFLAAGWFSNLSGFDTLATYHISRIVCGFLLLITLYYFGCLFFKKFSHRFFFLAFVSLSSGFGWLVFDPKLLFEKYSVICLDLWVTEAITFLIILTKPLFSASLILMLIILIYLFKCYNTNKSYFSIIAGISGLLLGLIHPYDLVTVCSINVLYLFLIKANFKQIRNFTYFLIFCAPSLIYEYTIFNYNQVFKEWAQKQLTTTPHPLSFIIGYGLIGLFAIFYILRDKKKSKPDFFLISWIICALILVYLPFRFQRRLILGLHIPLCICAAKFILDYLMPVIKKSTAFKGVRESILLGIVIILAAPGNFKYMLVNTEDMKNNISKYCLSNSDLEALKWIDKNTPSSAIIIASPQISQYIPGITGNKVYAGHYDQTINYSKKIRELAEFYKTDTIQYGNHWRGNLSLLTGINPLGLSQDPCYIYYGHHEQAMGNPNFKKVPSIKEIFRNDKITIYKAGKRPLAK